MSERKLFWWHVFGYSTCVIFAILIYLQSHRACMTALHNKDTFDHTRLKFEIEDAEERGYKKAMVDFYHCRPRYKIIEENDKAFLWKKDESESLPLFTPPPIPNVEPPLPKGGNKPMKNILSTSN